MTTQKKKYYSKEFKLEAIRLANHSDKPVTQKGVSREWHFLKGFRQGKLVIISEKNSARCLDISGQV